MTQKSKARLFFGLLILMITYVGFVFYVSEPTYSNIKDRAVCYEHLGEDDCEDCSGTGISTGNESCGRAEDLILKTEIYYEE